MECISRRVENENRLVLFSRRLKIYYFYLLAHFITGHSSSLSLFSNFRLMLSTWWIRLRSAVECGACWCLTGECWSVLVLVMSHYSTLSVNNNSRICRVSVRWWLHASRYVHACMHVNMKVYMNVCASVCRVCVRFCCLHVGLIYIYIYIIIIIIILNYY